MRKMDTYCTRCGKFLRKGSVCFSRDDPDHEESLCLECYRRFEHERGIPEHQNEEKTVESKE